MASKHSNERKRRSSKKYIILAILIIIAIAIIISFMSQNKEQTTNSIKTADDRLIGTWTTDGVTVYEFESKSQGKMKLPSAEYKFTYVLNDNKMYIDFESDKATDSNYEYSFEGDKLILKGINATTGTYTFSRK